VDVDVCLWLKCASPFSRRCLFYGLSESRRTTFYSEAKDTCISVYLNDVVSRDSGIKLNKEANLIHM